MEKNGCEITASGLSLHNDPNCHETQPLAWECYVSLNMLSVKESEITVFYTKAGESSMELLCMKFPAVQ